MVIRRGELILRKERKGTAGLAVAGAREREREREVGRERGVKSWEKGWW